MTAEQIIIEYLNSCFGGKPNVTLTEPKDRKGEYIVIERTGGRITNFINESTIAVQSFADSMSRAVIINDEVKAHMVNIISRNDVSACRLSSDYNYTDPESGKFRYQAVFDIFHG